VPICAWNPFNLTSEQVGLMSRASASLERKGAQKAMLKEKASEHAADLAMGLTSTMKKLIAGDSLICITCRATVLGNGCGPGKCECSGGRTKPSDDYDPKEALLNAAMSREKVRKDAVKGASAANQVVVAADKEKKKAGRGLDDLADLDLSSVDMVEIVFEAGKLGMALEKHAVSSVADGGAAAALKVKAGWVIRKVNDDDMPPDKAIIMKHAAAAMKAGSMTITFQQPLEDGKHHCIGCDKFIDAAQFDGAKNDLGAGPGRQTCCSCEEFADFCG